MSPSPALLASLRGCHVIALLSLFGTLVSLTLVAPAGLREAGGKGPVARAKLVRLAKWSCGAAILIGAGWTLSQVASIAGATSLNRAVAALTAVLPNTQFGHVMLVRFALVLAAFPLLRGGQWRLAAAFVLVGAALVLQGAVGHAGAAGGAIEVALLPSEALHLLAAGAWLGGLLPLLLLVESLPPRAATIACQSFTPVGLTSVLLIAVTALVQVWQWIGGIGGLFGTE